VRGQHFVDAQPIFRRARVPASAGAHDVHSVRGAIAGRKRGEVSLIRLSSFRMAGDEYPRRSGYPPNRNARAIIIPPKKCAHSSMSHAVVGVRMNARFRTKFGAVRRHYGDISPVQVPAEFAEMEFDRVRSGVGGIVRR
jgi:hypothetical protein